MNGDGVLRPIEIKQLFNFSFSTIMVFKCTKKKFANDFVKGDIFFNKPSSWVEEEKNGNKGRGDILEGTFITVRENDCSEYVKGLKSDPVLEHFNYNGFTYFRRKRSQALYCTCMYGLNNNTFNRWVEKSGKAHLQGKISKDYFTDFSENLTKADYESFVEEEKPVVIMIDKPHIFFERIRKALIEFGISEDDIIISPVDYVDKSTVSIAAIHSPWELLLKDTSYSHQSEVRVIINSLEPIIIEKMNSTGNVINIGNIEDICEIYDFYFEDMLFDIRNNNEILFNLPYPIEQSFEDMDIIELLELYINVEKEQTVVQEENEDGTFEQGKILRGLAKQEWLKDIKELIERKFGVVLNFSNGQICIYNASEEIFKTIEKKRKQPVRIDIFERQMEELVEKRDVSSMHRLIEEIDAGDSVMTMYAMYYKGKMNEINEDYVAAIDAYTIAINNNINVPNSLACRSNCYNHIGDYEKSLSDLERLQDIIGYRHDIYANKGICLINLNRLIEAIVAFDKSISLQQNNGFAFYNRSVAFFKMGEKEKAKADILMAISYEPQNSFYKESYEKYYR